MEILISVLVGELVSRSMSSIISRCSRKPPDMEADLERLLLRGQVIVDEAAGRHVTNHALLRQLTRLRDALFQGHYVLDAVRCRRRSRSYQDGDDEEEDSQQRLKIKGERRRRRSSSSRGIEEILHGLRSMIDEDAAEMAVFLATYPRLYRQPYSMHLLLDRCMFGRQMELQMVINFLLDSSNGGRFDVLPIVGPGVVGKSTLVAHVREDERVRRHFSQILFFSHGSCSFTDIATLTHRFTSPQQHDNSSSSSSNGGRPLLVVIDIAGNTIDDELYTKLSCLCKQSITSPGSKIILTSRSDKISSLGTTQTLTLQHLSPEAYWYYFKLATFGSSEVVPGDELWSVAMEMARIHNGSLFSASITASLLRTNLTVEFWSTVLAFLKGYLEKHFAVFGEHPSDILEEKRPMRFQRMGVAAADAIDFLIVDQYQISSEEEEVPELTFVDVMYGGVKPPEGPFKVLAWRSPIPPHHRFIYSCEIRDLDGDRAAVAKRKRAAGSTLARLL